PSGAVAHGIIARGESCVTPSDRPSFNGITVAAFESRHAAEMARLIESYDGKPLVAPSMREVPLEENGPAFEFGEALLKGEQDAVVFMTGVGTRYLIETLSTRWVPEAILAALRKVTVIARGPKPLKVLRDLDVPVSIT